MTSLKTKKQLVIACIMSVALTASSCSLIGGSGPKGVWKSEDGGQNWQAINWVKRPGQTDLQALLNNVSVRAIQYPPDQTNILYVTSTSGVFASEDGGQVWHPVLVNIDATSLKVAYSDPNIVYVAGQVGGRGVIYKSLNRGKDWEQKYFDANSNPVNSIAVNPKDANNVIAGFNSGLLLETRDGGTTWSLRNTLIGRVRQMEFRANDPSVLYVLLSDHGLYVSRNKGDSFSPVTRSLNQFSSTAFDLNLDGSENIVRNENHIPPEVYYEFTMPHVGPENIYLTTNNGAFVLNPNSLRWRRLVLPIEPRAAKTLAVYPVGDGRVVYVSVDGLIYRSDNGGASFKTLKVPVGRLIRSILTLPGDPNTVYIGTS